MNFMFSWQEQYPTRSLRSLVRYCSCHSNIKFISSRHRVISSISLLLSLSLLFYFFADCISCHLTWQCTFRKKMFLSFAPYFCVHSLRLLFLKWHYDHKIISFYYSDFESVFAKHPTGKILSFVFYPKAVYFECKFWISRSAITHVQNWPIGHQRVGSRENVVIYWLA